ncbi:MAG: tetratricopeptide repeat protein [Allosphingosinicella sp.]
MRRRKASNPGRGAAGWIAIAALALVSAFIAWRVVQTSAADALIRTNPAGAVLVAPRDPRVPMTLAMLEFQATAGKVRPKSRQAAIDALRHAPLADEPYFLAGMEALIQGDEAKAEQLLAEARRRNPRSRFARLILLDRYLRTGKIDLATGEMTALGNLIPAAGNILTKELARLARAPATADALVQALRRNPAPRDRLLEHLADSGGDPDLILRLAREIPGEPTPGGAAWQTKLVASLVTRGQVDRAYQLWRTFSSPRAPARKDGVYDAELRGLPGIAPFNWYFTTTAAGAAERSPNGLQVEFYGRENAELAGQLLTLAPGRYRLSLIAEGAADGESSKLSWTVECLQSKARLGELPLAGVNYSPRRLGAEFTVPPQGCSAQWLRLIGTSSEFTKAQNATLRSLSLTAVR